jgi:hypothetical protein
MASLVARRMGRRRGRGVRWVLGVVALAAVAAVSGALAYQVATSRYAMEAERLRRDLAVVREASRRAVEQAAAAEQRATLALARSAQAQRERDSAVPRGDAARLLGLLEARLADGLEPERLAFLIHAARAAPPCEDKLEVKRFQPRTPLSTSTLETPTFHGDKVTVTAQAAALRDEDGALRQGFDPAKPVELRFTVIGGAIETARGELPLGHSFVLGGRELRFLARSSDKAPGRLELSMQSCAYP